jgi:hypothetical protein
MKKCIGKDILENDDEVMEPRGDEGGNTETPSKQKIHREIQYKYWSFTLNNFEMETVKTLESILQGECMWYIFQEETGESGTPHLQGTLYLKNKQRLNQLKVWCKQIHWEATRSVKASIAYCLKEESRTGSSGVTGLKSPKRSWYMSHGGGKMML